MSDLRKLLAGATPRPWDWFSRIRQSPSEGHYFEKARGTSCMKTLIGSDGQGFAYSVGLAPATDEANIDLIVYLVNHAERLAACEELAAQVDAYLREMERLRELDPKLWPPGAVIPTPIFDALCRYRSSKGAL